MIKITLEVVKQFSTEKLNTALQKVVTKVQYLMFCLIAEFLDSYHTVLLNKNTAYTHPAFALAHWQTYNQSHANFIKSPAW